jgi:hypothetical protein
MENQQQMPLNVCLYPQEEKAIKIYRLVKMLKQGRGINIKGFKNDEIKKINQILKAIFNSN